MNKVKNKKNWRQNKTNRGKLVRKSHKFSMNIAIDTVKANQDNER